MFAQFALGDIEITGVQCPLKGSLSQDGKIFEIAQFAEVFRDPFWEGRNVLLTNGDLDWDALDCLHSLLARDSESRVNLIATMVNDELHTNDYEVLFKSRDGRFPAGWIIHTNKQEENEYTWKCFCAA